MFEDGVYVSFFSDDTAKKKTPQSVIVIKNQRVSVGINPDSADDIKLSLARIAGMAQSQADKEYDENLESALSRYFEWNGYTPKPSDFYELADSKGQNFANLPLNWTRV